MAQPIMHKNRKQGITLIELLLYMSIFIILIGGVLYTSIYMQKTITYSTFEYEAQEQIYTQLDMLQQYLHTAIRVEVGSSSIKIFGTYGYIEQSLQDASVHITYVYTSKPKLDLIAYPFLQYEEFSFIPHITGETVFGKSILFTEIKRIDSRGKLKILKEWLIAPSLPKNL